MSLRIAIVGSGSAATAAALTSAERGARVTVIERATVGGTCVNVGCVPSKALLQAAAVAHVRRQGPFDTAISAIDPAIDRQRLQFDQGALITRLRQSKYERILLDTPGITLMRGEARFRDEHTLEVCAGEGACATVAFDRCLIATGARPRVPPVDGLTSTPYWTSTEALGSSETPPRLLVMGSSAVALELAQAYHRLGSQVTILARGGLLSREDPALGKALAAALRSEGIEIREQAVVAGVSHAHGTFCVTLTDGNRLGSERLLVATGRSPVTGDLDLEAAGVATDGSGAIMVDERLQTTSSDIFAAGDCTTLPQFVYVAAAAGTKAAVNMTGGQARLDLEVLPAVVFTDPEVASVGWTAADAARRGIEVVSRRLTLDQVPRAIVSRHTQGLITVVAEGGTGRIVGVHVVAPTAGELIATAALAIRQGLTVEDLAGLLVPYLTMSEGLKLAAQTFSRDVSRLSCCAG